MRPQPLRNLTDEELIDRCHDHGIRIDIPYSQIENDALLHGVSVALILRNYLILRLEEMKGL